MWHVWFGYNDLYFHQISIIAFLQLIKYNAKKCLQSPLLQINILHWLATTFQFCNIPIFQLWDISCINLLLTTILSLQFLLITDFLQGNLIYKWSTYCISIHSDDGRMLCTCRHQKLNNLNMALTYILIVSLANLNIALIPYIL